jgi:Photosynthesis system II assembly factor YCF48
MEQLPKIVQRRLQGTPKPGVHPDADLLAAFAEKSLNDRERSLVLQHLGECADCRDVVSLAMPEIESTPSPIAGGSSWLSWPALRWGALAACVVVVSAAVTLHYGRRQSLQPPLAEPAASTADSVFTESKVLKPGEELAAKLPPPSPIESGRDFVVAGNLAKQREKSTFAGPLTRQTGAAAPQRLEKNEKDQLTSNRLDSARAVSPTDKPTQPALAAAAPAPLPTGKTVPAEPEAEARNDAVDYKPKAMTETVTVEGAATAELETSQTVERKAKNESVSNESQKKVQTARTAAAGAMAVGGRNADTLSAEVAQTTVDDYAKRAGPGQVATRWTLSADGVLQRSFDSGKSWQTIQVAKKAVFRALAANDLDIWVAGSGGALYHSSDAGQHWIQVSPEADGKPLTADIVTVEFSDSQHGKLTTANRETWTTNDAGGTWRKR